MEAKFITPTYVNSFSVSLKYALGIIGTVLNQNSALGRIAILKLLILLIH